MKMNTKACVFTLVGFLCLLATMSSYSWAQQTSGTVVGTVRDDTGGVIPGVSVEATNVNTGIVRTVLSDDEGRYRASNLAPGSYEVSAELVGFQRLVRTGITVTIGAEQLVDLTLSVGELSNQVIVSGEAPLVETTSSGLSGLVDEKRILDLPLNQRNFIQLATLESGVIWQRNFARDGASNIGYGMKILVAGSRPTGNNFMLDGTDINEPHGRTPGSATGSTLGVEAVKEFRIYTKNYSAELGRATGGVINVVTKSGTNAFHGSIFEFHRNDNLDARNFFDPGEQPEFIRNQFGFSLGGPIIRERTFFFTTYEGVRESKGQSLISNVPSLTARQGLLPDPANPGQLRQIDIKEEVKPFLEFYPLPNGRDFGDGRAEFLEAFARVGNEDYFSGRVDHTFSDSVSGFVRYTYNDASLLAPGQGFARGISALTHTTDESRKQYLTIELTNIISPSLINTFRAGYNQTIYDTNEVFTVNSDHLTLVAGTTGGARVSPPGWSRVGSSDFWPVHYAYHVYDFSDTLSYNLGRHSIRFGGQFQKMLWNSRIPTRQRGRWSFSTLEDFMLGNARSVQVAPPSISEPHRALRQSLFAFFFQDDYQIRSNLTLNLGLRYEPTTATNEKHGRLSQIPQEKLLDFTASHADITTTGDYYDTPKMVLAPRVGFAWDPFGDGNTAIRGGFGMFYDHIQLRWIGSFLSVRTFPDYNVINERSIAFPQTDAELIAQFGDVGTQAAMVQSNPKNQYMMHWNLNLQRQLPQSIVLTFGYAGSRGVRLGRFVNLNKALPIEVVNGTPKFSSNPVLPNTSFESMNLLMTDSDSVYHGLEMNFKKRWSSNFGFQLAYTWSKAIANSPGVRTSSDMSDSSTTSAHLLHAQQYDRSNSAYHVPHSFNLNFTYDFPGNQLAGTAGLLLGGWQLNNILTVASGSFFTVTSGTNSNTSLIGDGRRPDLIPGKSNSPVLGGPDKYFDAGSFAPPDPQFWGTLGRNTVHGPGVTTFDLSMVKSTPIPSVSENFAVQFRFETFNLFNTPNFGTPSRAVFDGAGNPRSAGRITRTSTTGREIQLGLKIIF